MNSGAGRTISYDAENRPVSIDNSGDLTTMAYDYSGDRVKKSNAGITTDYVGTLYESSGSVTAKYIFAGSTRVAMRRSDGTLLYYHANHLGSTHIVTDSSGNQVEEIHYEPFGKTYIDSGSLSVKHKYTSQEFDSETELYYYRARYYDPALGRFIQADAIGTVFSNPQTLNRYSYTNNNPMTYSDPTGHCGFSSFGDLGDCFVQAGNWVDENIIDPVADFFTDNIINPVSNFLEFGGGSIASPALPGLNPYTGAGSSGRRNNPFSFGAGSGGPQQFGAGGAG